MPFRHLIFNRRNGAPRRPADFVPPTLDSVQDFSLEDEFPVYNWSDTESPAHLPTFMQQTPEDQPLKPLPSGNAWVNDNPTVRQASTGEPYGNHPWASPHGHGPYQTSQFGSSLDLSTQPGLYTGSQGSVASSISSYSSFDLTSFSGDDVKTMSSDSRRQSTTSMSDIAPGANTSSLCPLLTGQVGTCKPSLCGPNAPCLNFAGIVPPIEECAISVPEDEELEQEFDGQARPLSRHSQAPDTSPQLVRTGTPISQQPRRTSTRTKRPPTKPFFKDAPVSDTRAMKKSKARQAHSLVERKYRENLNAKIQELHERLQTTSLSIRARRRSSTSRTSRSDDSDLETDLAAEELRTNIKAKKSDVLVEAMGYVEASEAEMRQMRSDMKQLQDKINILENMIMRHDCNMPATAPDATKAYRPWPYPATACYEMLQNFMVHDLVENQHQKFAYIMQLISATPSPYARKVRIALAEKAIPFDLKTEVPWDSTTKTPQYNPLEKLPVLINDDGSAVYESHYILEWLEAKYGAPKYQALFPERIDDLLLAKQIQVVTDGMCDACVLLFFEKQRSNPSDEWQARQMRKVAGGLKALSDWIGDKDFIIDDKFTLADIAAGSVLGYMKVRFSAIDWQSQYPNLKRYSDKLEERESFKNSVPYPQNISDKIV